MTCSEGPLKVRGSQASDSKEELCGRQPTILLHVVFLIFIALKKNQKHKNILAETIIGTKIFKSNNRQNRDTFRVKRDTIFASPLMLHKIFLS